MIRHVVVGCATGLHARAASRVAAAAAAEKIAITVRRAGGDPVPADSVLSLLTLAATQGTELILEATGPSAATALAGVAAVISADMDEPPSLAPFFSTPPRGFRG
jgi:phosphocarrier protein